VRALILENRTIEVCDTARPVPADGQALIRVTLAGICNTDLELIQGYMGFNGIPGHEFVGIVEESSDPSWTGKRVVGEINLACGNCDACRKGLGRHCPNRTVLGILNHNGTMAEYAVLPLENLYEVPDNVPDEAAVFTEPLAAALEINEQIAIKPDDRVLVQGDGKLGQLIARTLALTGCRLTVLGRNHGKLERLRKLGINATGQIAEAEKFDIVVEVTGTAQGFESAVRHTRPRGTLLLKSTVAEGVALNLAPLVIDEITVLGSRCGPFAPALRMLSKGIVSVTDLIDARYPLQEAVSAFEHARKKGVVKVLLEM
jgi:threonine dehydrogenase-like Zn-dependent dehydrogenase